jgi:hypothetical protein
VLRRPGLDYKDVAFASVDSVPLQGWVHPSGFGQAGSTRRAPEFPIGWFSKLLRQPGHNHVK